VHTYNYIDNIATHCLVHQRLAPVTVTSTEVL
jgi:hypothetical protein